MGCVRTVMVTVVGQITCPHPSWGLGWTYEERGGEEKVGRGKRSGGERGGVGLMAQRLETNFSVFS